nr:integrin alpha-PS2 isoform X1 [Onthophagus taurus]
MGANETSYWCGVNRLVIVILCCASLISCYNVDTVNFVKHTRRDQEMFGFSVAAHRERGNSWILVGAPKGQSHKQSLQGVKKGGAVFKCDTTRNDSCSEIEFDPRGDTIRNNNVIDKKSEQWFGATLHSAGTDGPVVACAPRYVWFTMRSSPRRDPVGTCFVARNNFQNVSEYAPCRTSNWGYNRQGWCQAGFSAAISKDARRLFIGAPGSWYWQGQMYSVDANAEFLYWPGSYLPFGAGQVIQKNLESRPAVVQTAEGSAVDDDSYLGYSMVVGDFNNEGFQGIAAGMPKGNELRGKVLLYTWNLTNFKNITGTQLGSYFGYSIAAGDIDGDGLDDLVIGAPLFTLPNNEAKYEVGRAYVIYQSSLEGSFRKIHELDGFNSKSRFGLSVASLGDINLDGYGDFAVGAPYDGPNERGAVYIFHGSQNGVRKKFTQKITSEEMSLRYGGPISTFGFSISGGVDLDGNDYPDTVIGAYLSNTVYFLRSRPVAKIGGKVEFAIQKIILEQKNCTLRRDPVACTSFKVCFNYTGVGVPLDIRLNVEYNLDSKKPTDPRMFFLDYPNERAMNESFDLRKNQRENCKIKYVYVKNEIRDKLNPLEVEAKYSMEHGEAYDRGQLIPILDLTEPPIRKDSITVHKNCGSDSICIPDLSLTVKPNFERYLLGSKEKLEFDVIVENAGEDSFETTFSIQIPEGVDFNKVVEVDRNEVRVSCTAGENNTINCDVGNPLPTKTIAHFKLELKPYHKEGMKPSYDFFMVANSTNPETPDTLFNNKLALSIPIYVNSTLFIHGKTKRTEIRYNVTSFESKTIKHETDIGPQILQKYIIKNEGPSTINETEMVFIWPAATKAGDDLMYLVEGPEIEGDVVCEESYPNHKNYLRAHYKKSILASLEDEITQTETSSSTSSSSFSSSGVRLEEGPVRFGKLPEETKIDTNRTEINVEKSGDASFVHQQRQQEVFEESQKGHGSGTKTVHVTEDKGQGQTVTTITTTQNRTTPVVTTNTFWKNTTTFYGPDGNVVKQETTSGGSPSGTFVHQQSGTQHSRGQYGSTDEYGNTRQYGGSSGWTQHTSSQGSSRDKQFKTSGDARYEGGRTDEQSRRQYGSNEERRYQGSSSSGSHATFNVQNKSSHQQSSNRNNDNYQPVIYNGAYASEEYYGETNNYDVDKNRLRPDDENQRNDGYSRGHSTSGRTHDYSGSHSAQGHGYTGSQSSSGQTHGYSGTHSSSYGNQNKNWDEDYANHGLGAAALDHGFKTGGLDLGILGSGKNVDETISRPAGEHYDPDLGLISTAQSGANRQSGHGYQQSSGNQWSQESRWSSGGGSHTSLERDNVETERPNYRARHLGRKKRQTIDLNAADIKDVVKCEATECRFVKCVAGPLKKNEDITVGFRWRVNVHTIRNVSSSQPIKFATMALARISKVPYIGSPINKTLFKHEIVTTVLPPETDGAPSVVPLWVVVLSAIAGVVILLLLAFLLYKCGFFKRNRVSDAPERQPLNKNGHYYNGDEAL